MLYFFSVLLIILIIISALNITVETSYKDKIFSFALKIAGIRLAPSKPRVKKSEKKESGKKESFKMDNIRFAADAVSLVLPDLKKAAGYFKGKIKCSEFTLEIEFSLADACECGIANGIIWAAVGSLFPIFQTAVEIKSPEIRITPLFSNTDYLSISYTGIYKLKIYHIIITGLYFIKIYNKIKKFKGGVKNG